MKPQVAVLALLFLTISCNTTEPPAEEGPKPGRRDYIWSTDTLRGELGDLVALLSIWGSSPSDIWAVGTSPTSRTAIWHYDGTRWRPDSVVRNVQPFSVFGFQQNDVWLANLNGTFWHFDGADWSLFSTHTIGGFPRVQFINIWGETPNNIYSVGAASSSDGSIYKGIVMHFDGLSWTPRAIPDMRVAFVWIRKGIREGDAFYMTAIRNESFGDTTKLFEFAGQNMNLIYQTSTEVATVNEVAGRIYLAIGKKVFKYQGGQLQLWKDFSNTAYRGRLWGRGETDFFSVAEDGLDHFNGTDIVTIYPTNMTILDLAVFTSDVFVLCFGQQAGGNEGPIVIHGRLPVGGQ